MREALWIALVGVVVVIVVVIRFAVRSERRLGTPTQRAALATLHTANLAAPPLRTGLDKGSAERAIPHLRQLIGTSGVAIADTFGILAAEGIDARHCWPAAKRRVHCREGSSCPSRPTTSWSAPLWPWTPPHRPACSG
jgi:two-component system LytT family sensor kinase